MNRSLRLLPLLALFACAPAPSPVPAAEAPTVVMVLRHAEKAPAPADDPPLSAAGARRAELLADALADAPVAAIYSTQFRRTRDTVQPLATRLGVPVTVREASESNAAAYPAALAAEVLAAHRADTLLVVGHSNTVPAIVEAIGAPRPPPIDESEYGALFTVTVPPSGPASVAVGRYGDAIPPR